MFAVFSSLAVGIIVPTVKTASKTQELETELDRDRFLAEGFFKLCSEKKDEDLKSALVDWKKMCWICGRWISWKSQNLVTSILKNGTSMEKLLQ